MAGEFWALARVGRSIVDWPRLQRFYAEGPNVPETDSKDRSATKTSPPGSAPIETQWRCPECLHANTEKPTAPGAGPWVCSQCGETQPAHLDAINDDGRIVACPVCSCADIYRQRDFNRKLGIGIIAVGAVLAPFTKFLSLIVCGAIDFLIFRFVPEVVICYHCHATFRHYPGAGEAPLFDLNISDKYIPVERERGW